MADVQAPAGSCLLDANIWIANPLLNNPVAAALLFVLQKRRYTIALPEVVEEEVIKAFVNRARELSQEIKDDFDWFQVVMGQRDDYRLPAPYDVEERVRSRLDDLAPLLTRIPLTLDLTRRALRRVYQGLPPAGPKNEQFRDCTIWETVIALAVSGPVAFITEDRAFYEGHDPTRGPVAPLRDEIVARAHPISIYPTIRPYLQSLTEPEPPIDRAAVAALIQPAVESDILAHLSKGQIRLGPRTSYEIVPFITYRPTILAIEFDFTYEVSVSDAEPPPTLPTRLIAVGSCTFDPPASTVADVRTHLIQLRGEDGTLLADLRNIVYASGVGGRRTIPYTFKYRLSGGS